MTDFYFINCDVRSFQGRAKAILGQKAAVVDFLHPRDCPIEKRHQVTGIIVRLGCTLDKTVLDWFPHLKVVATITTGQDHIDREHCRLRGIQVLSLKGETAFLKGIHATPEMTWALLLALVRRLPAAFASVCAGQWDREAYFGNELFQKTIGIVGFGRVGKIVGRYAHAFGMRVLCCDLNQKLVADYPFDQVALVDLLVAADVVSLHLPLEKETTGFFGQAQFAHMKKSAFLINTARGAIVDEGALLQALVQGDIAGAATDVLADETRENGVHAKHPLICYARENDNLVISPHTAGSTHESMENTGVFIAQKICAWVAKQAMV